jgi:DNA (cytosine-5)-methyltransferase 1
MVDGFCKAGGAAKGYNAAGFDVIGVDIEPQPNYPYHFVQGDVLDVFPRLLAAGLPIVFAHMSPPCQFATAGNRALRAQGRSAHLNLVPPTRTMLEASGLPYVIENVEAARPHLIDPIMLCGRQFGLGAVDTDGEWLTLDRHRLFESNLPLGAPASCRPHKRVQVAGVYGGARRDKVEARTVRHGGYVPASLTVLRRLLGIDWMTFDELCEAIPPAFTAHLGPQVLRELGLERAA